MTVFVVPGGNLVPPPKLSADAPVLNVLHPLVVSVDPVFWHKANFTRFNRSDSLFCNGQSLGIQLAFFSHGHKPLIGQHRFNDLSGSLTSWDHEGVGFDVDQETRLFQILHNVLACFKAVQSLIGLGGLVIDTGIQIENIDLRQLVTHTDSKVIGIVCRRDLDHARPKVLVHVGIGNHGDQSLAQRQMHPLTDQVLVPCVFGVDHDRHVAQHGLRTGGRHHQAFIGVLDGIGDVPHEAFFFLAFHFQVGDSCFKDGVPVNKSFAPVDEAFLVELDKSLGHDLASWFIHGEVLATPVHAVTHAAHLLGDGFATFLLPFPNFSDEVFSGDLLCGAKGVLGQALLLELPLNHNLSGDPRMIGAWDPCGVGARHAVIAGQAVHDRLIEGVPHVQSTRHIGRWELNAKPRRTRLCYVCTFEASHTVATGFPFWAPVGFNFSGFKGFGQAL